MRCLLLWSILAGIPELMGATVYVSPLGSHQAPFADWQTAATNLPVAVAESVDGDTILVSNGVYRLTQEVALPSAVHLRSLNGPAVTIVDGMQSNRCVYLQNVRAVVEGLTIRNGLAELGGGVRFGNGGTLRDSVVEQNRATRQGGGGIFLRWGGLIERCQIRNNIAEDGDGGGVYCLSGGTVRDCYIFGNTARVGGGVAALFHSTLINCLVVSNSATQAGGIFCSQSGRIQNCTVAYNTARVAGGLHGFYGGEIRNTILFANIAASGANYFNLESSVSGTVFSYCCTSPIASGPGNIGLDPAWVNAAAGDYRLQPGSPCIDAGENAGAPGTDLEGFPRPIDGDTNGLPVVDMGAYEYSP